MFKNICSNAITGGISLRRQIIKLSHLCRTKNTEYWFWHEIDWLAIPAWIAG